MGNASLRREVAKLIKKRGFGRLYLPGCKHKARKYYSSYTLRGIRNYLSVSLGDTINDCDGLNHVVKKYLYRRWAREDGGVFDADQFEFEDGRRSCGCGLIEEPFTREKIRNNLIEYWKSQEETESGRTWLSKVPSSAYQKWKRGEEWEVCDENGFMLPDNTKKEAEE